MKSLVNYWTHRTQLAQVNQVESKVRQGLMKCLRIHKDLTLLKEFWTSKTYEGLTIVQRNLKTWKIKVTRGISKTEEVNDREWKMSVLNRIWKKSFLIETGRGIQLKEEYGYSDFTVKGTTRANGKRKTLWAYWEEMSFNQT